MLDVLDAISTGRHFRYCA